MKHSVALVALTFLALLSKFAPALAAPSPEAKAPAKVKAADPLDIPAFAPIPNEFVFAGTQKDVYKLLSRYTGGISLADVPEPTAAELGAIKDKTVRKAARLCKLYSM